MALGRYKTALKDFKAVCLKKPKDKVRTAAMPSRRVPSWRLTLGRHACAQDARRKYANCKKQVKLQAFREAIATEDAPSVTDTLDVDSMGAWGHASACVVAASWQRLTVYRLAG